MILLLGAPGDQYKNILSSDIHNNQKLPTKMFINSSVLVCFVLL
jgi:hypothetical protein